MHRDRRNNFSYFFSCHELACLYFEPNISLEEGGVLLKFHAKIKVKTPTYNFDFFCKVTWSRHVYDKNRFYLWNPYNILQTLSQKEQVANKQSYGLCRRSLKPIQIEKMNCVCILKYSWLREWYCIQLESWTFKIFHNW